MKTVRLGDVCKVVSGSTPERVKAEYWGGNIPWVAPKEINRLSSPYLFDSVEKITEAGFKSCSTEMLPVGSLLLSSRAPIGLLAINKISVCTNQGFKSLVPTEAVHVEFLYYYLKCNVKSLQAKGNGATFKELSKPAAANFPVPLPPIHDQIRIAHLLGKVEGLIAQRKENLQQLNELLKSVFLEMFGDPVRNEKGWVKKTFSEISDSRLGKMRDKQFITGNHLRKYVGNSNVQWFRFNLTNLEEMDFDEKERQVFKLSFGDLLICEGGDIGRCAIWRENKDECYFQKALHRVKLNAKFAIAEYIQYVMLFYSLFNGFKNVTCKATIAHLTGEKLKETSVPLPPLDLQNQFAATVEKVESLKSRYQHSLTELENLYGVLSQKAFKGELDLAGVVAP